MTSHSRLLVGFAFACLGAPFSGKVSAAGFPHEIKGGASVSVHWAHLEGHFGNNDKLRTDLREEIQKCAAIRQQAGLPHKAPSESQIPALVKPMEIDIYHADNRVAIFQKGKVYGYHPIDCSLTEEQFEKATITSPKGICNIDLRQGFAAGMCAKAVHAAAPKFGRANQDKIAADSALRGMLPTATGNKKMIAGLQCDVYEITFPVQASYCASKAGVFQATRSLYSNVPGLQLEVRSEDQLNLVATRAKLDILVSDTVFEVPAGVTLRTAAGGKK